MSYVSEGWPVDASTDSVYPAATDDLLTSCTALDAMIHLCVCDVLQASGACGGGLFHHAVLALSAARCQVLPFGASPMWPAWRSSSRSSHRGTSWRLLAAALTAAICLRLEMAAAQAPSPEPSPALPADAMRRFFLNTTDPFAVCNDGTSGAAAARPSSAHCLHSRTLLAADCHGQQVHKQL